MNAKYLSPIDNSGAELKKYILDTAEILKPILSDIHAIQPTTKNYYAEYMNILGNTKHIKLLALALIYAGANVDGVHNAVSILEAK